MATRILHERRSGRSVRCVVLTNGARGGQSASTRDSESLAALARLGVPAEAVCFLGSRHAIQDSALVHSLDRSLALVKEHLGGTRLEQIFCLAWEGGHPDHDASHLVALALAREQRLQARLWQFSLYNGAGTPGPLFRVMAPLNAPACRTRRVKLGDALRILRMLRLYRSQRRTMLGLLPEAVVKLVLLRRESMQATTPEAVLRKPHVGRLFYERRFGVEYDDWRAAAEPFIRRRITGPGVDVLQPERDG
jgi:LmbE family N-acetylglucosaminyl deacetylase